MKIQHRKKQGNRKLFPCTLTKENQAKRQQRVVKQITTPNKEKKGRNKENQNIRYRTKSKDETRTKNNYVISGELPQKAQDTLTTLLSV